MTPPIKPSSIVHTRAQVEAIRVYTPEEVDACAKRMKFYDHQIAASILTSYAAMLRELAGRVPVSALVALADQWGARERPRHAGDYSTGLEDGFDFAEQQLRDLINQHRAST